MQFTGFFPQTLEFFQQLSMNNNKPWFAEHKPDYLEFVLNPMQKLVADLSGQMLNIDPLFETRPVVDRTISRSYRDTRFSQDKSPYKTKIWFTFKRPKKEWTDYPTYFFELSADGYSYGLGYYAASKATMDTFREQLCAKPASFQEAISFYAQQTQFVLEGNLYKRPLPGCPSDALQTWYQRKSFYLISEKPVNPALFSSALVEELSVGFQLLAPLYHYLVELKK